MELDVVGGNEVVGHIIECWQSQYDHPSHEREGKVTDVISFVPARSFVAPAKGTSVVLSLLPCEGYFIRGETYDLTILFVELTFAFDEPASQEAVDEW